MNLFSKNLEHLLGASYLSGAAEALVKSKSLNSQQFEKNLDELKQVRKSLLEKAESDGHKEPKLIIEDAKKVAYKILKNEISTTNEHKNKLFEDSEVNNKPDSTMRNTNMNSSNVMKNSSNVTKNSSNITNSPKNSPVGLMPLDNKSTANSTTTLVTKTPPPVLQLGGRRSKKSKKSKSKSRKHRK